MKTNLYSKYLVAAISLAGIFIAMTMTADSAFAQPRRAVEVRHPAQRHGKVVVGLPKNHRAVSVGRTRYFYHHGTFYRKAPVGYAVVNAPPGAVVFDLPIGFRAVLVGGSPILPTAVFTTGGFHRATGLFRCRRR